MQKLLFFHNNFILGGDTFYLSKILKRLSSDDFVLIYGSSKPVREYIGNLGFKRSSLVNFNSYSGPYFDSLINNKKTIARLPLRVFIRLISPLLAVFLFIRLIICLHAIDLKKFNRIVVNSGGFDGNLTSRLFLRLVNRKCTYILHNHIPEEILNNAQRFSSIARYVNVWIVGSKVIKKQLVDDCGIPKERVYFIPYGIDLSLDLSTIDTSVIRKKLRVSKDAYLILHPSTFEKRKGHYYTISAFKDLKDKITDSKLVLAGANGVDERAVRKLIHDLGIQNDVIFTGFYSPIEELIKACDVLCLPSQEYDTTSFVILLALACGTPVLTTQREDFDGFLRDDYNALLVAKGNYAIITEKLWRLYNDGTLRDRLIKNGLATHNDYFSENRMAEDTVALLKG